MTCKPDRLGNTRLAFVAFFVLLAPISTAYSENQPERPLADQYSIYDTLLNQAPLGAWRPTGPFVIAAETRLPEYLCSNVSYLKQHFPHLDPAIFDSLFSANVRPARHDKSRFAVKAILIETKELRQIPINSPTWEQFEQNFPGSRIAVSVSTVAFNEERTTALVYWDYVCGGLCGQGFLTQLDLIDSRWMIVKTLPLWVS